MMTEHDRIPVGKYRGRTLRTITDTDPLYLMWAFKNVSGIPEYLYRECEQRIWADYELMMQQYYNDIGHTYDTSRTNQRKNHGTGKSTTRSKSKNASASKRNP